MHFLVLWFYSETFRSYFCFIPNYRAFLLTYWSTKGQAPYLRCPSTVAMWKIDYRFWKKLVKEIPHCWVRLRSSALSLEGNSMWEAKIFYIMESYNQWCIYEFILIYRRLISVHLPLILFYLTKEGSVHLPFLKLLLKACLRHI